MTAQKVRVNFFIILLYLRDFVEVVYVQVMYNSVWCNICIYYYDLTHLATRSRLMENVCKCNCCLYV